MSGLPQNAEVFEGEVDAQQLTIECTVSSFR